MMSTSKTTSKGVTIDCQPCARPVWATKGRWHRLTVRDGARLAFERVFVPQRGEVRRLLTMSDGDVRAMLEASDG